MGYGVIRVRIRNLSPLLVAALSFAYLLSYPLAMGRADESLSLYGAKRVLDGQVLYKDFFEYLTPLSFYIFAGFYYLGGTTLRAARVGMALIEAMGSALLFHLVRRVAGTLEAIIATLIFVCICLPTWPYASPHWMSTVLGLLVATVTLAETLQRSSRARPLVAGMLTGVAICIQQQRGVFLAAWLPLALAVLSSQRPRATRWRTLATEIVWGVGGAVVVTALVLGHAAWTSSPAAVRDAIYLFPTRHYGPTFSGRTAWAEVPPLTQAFRASTWLWLLRISPVFLVAEGLLLLRGVRRRRDRPYLERACLWLLAALMTLAIWYLPDFIHVSFALPVLLIPGASALHELRSAAVWARVPAGRRIVTAGAWLFALAVAGNGAANVAYAWAIAPIRLETGFGVLDADPGMARLYHAVGRHLVRERDGRSLLYSYPTDAWLYLTLRADDATRFSTLIAGMYPDEHIQEVVDVVRRRRPGTVVVLIPFADQAIPRALEGGYEMAEEASPYRVYVRNGDPESPAPGPVQ